MASFGPESRGLAPKRVRHAPGAIEMAIDGEDEDDQRAPGTIAITIDGEDDQPGRPRGLLDLPKELLWSVAHLLGPDPEAVAALAQSCLHMRALLSDEGFLVDYVAGVVSSDATAFRGPDPCPVDVFTWNLKRRHPGKPPGAGPPPASLYATRMAGQSWRVWTRVPRWVHGPRVGRAEAERRALLVIERLGSSAGGGGCGGSDGPGPGLAVTVGVAMGAVRAGHAEAAHRLADAYALGPGVSDEQRDALFMAAGRREAAVGAAQRVLELTEYYDEYEGAQLDCAILALHNPDRVTAAAVLDAVKAYIDADEGPQAAQAWVDELANAEDVEVDAQYMDHSVMMGLAVCGGAYNPDQPDLIEHLPVGSLLVLAKWVSVNSPEGEAALQHSFLGDVLALERGRRAEGAGKAAAVELSKPECWGSWANYQVVNGAQTHGLWSLDTVERGLRELAGPELAARHLWDVCVCFDPSRRGAWTEYALARLFEPDYIERFRAAALARPDGLLKDAASCWSRCEDEGLQEDCDPVVVPPLVRMLLEAGRPERLPALLSGLTWLGKLLVFEEDPACAAVLQSADVGVRLSDLIGCRGDNMHAPTVETFERTRTFLTALGPRAITHDARGARGARIRLSHDEAQRVGRFFAFTPQLWATVRDALGIDIPGISLEYAFVAGASVMLAGSFDYEWAVIGTHVPSPGTSVTEATLGADGRITFGREAAAAFPAEAAEAAVKPWWELHGGPSWPKAWARVQAVTEFRRAHIPTEYQSDVALGERFIAHLTRHL
jgi:hypothetical protein